MSFDIAAMLAIDGVVIGAVYALLAIATVLLFSVTRILFIAQGEFVAYGALTLAMLQAGQVPRTVWLLLALACWVAVLDFVSGVLQAAGPRRLFTAAANTLAYPLVACAVAYWASGQNFPLVVQAIITLALVAPCGSLVYWLAYEPLADASVLVLLIVSVGVHFAMLGAGLLFFGPEGFRNPAFWSASIGVGSFRISGQNALIVALVALLILGLWLFFEYSLRGKALRATAINRKGAKLVGISGAQAGRLSFTMAGFIGALSGLMVGSTTTVFYDSGFLVGLKGFVAAVLGSLASYPLALAGAIALGQIETLGSFGASAYKEVIVFTAILPVLLWRSLTTTHQEGE